MHTLQLKQLSNFILPQNKLDLCRLTSVDRINDQYLESVYCYKQAFTSLKLWKWWISSNFNEHYMQQSNTCCCFLSKFRGGSGISFEFGSCLYYRWLSTFTFLACVAHGDRTISGATTFGRGSTGARCYLGTVFLFTSLSFVKKVFKKYKLLINIVDLYKDCIQST